MPAPNSVTGARGGRVSSVATVISRALILAAGKGISIGDPAVPNCLTTVGRCNLLERTWGCSRASASGASASASASKPPPFASSSRLGGAGDGDEAPRHVLRKRSLAGAQRPVGAGRAAVRHRTDAAADGRPDRRARAGARAGVAAASGDRSVLAIDRDLSRVFDIDDATKVKLAGDRVTEIGKGLTAYDAVSAGMFVDVAVADRRAGVAARAVADRRRRGGGGAGAGGRARRRHQAVAGRRQPRDEAARRLVAARVRRRAGEPGDAGGAAVVGGRDAGADRAAARREGPARLRAVQPRAGDDVGAREGVAGPPRRLPPRRRLFGGGAADCRTSCGPRSARRPRTRCC